ncbi:MAG: leucine-rich repeat protein [Acetobacter sp.]|nr:leucine-rich repeat protein [Bacteroides sp.]MCM1340877.1 leucine-rich repeat protein [Acetobacter sp.]MCM1432566.1 leucine-rich repeat protein [Clostridiales bacterium]
MKKFISLFLSIITLFTMLSMAEIVSFAATGNTGDLSYSYDTSTKVLTLTGSGYSKNYENKTLNRAPWYAMYRNSIKSVVVENGVKGLGSYLFYGCTAITSVSIPDSVDTIGDCCFRGCTALTNITLPDNCTWYYKELFLDCSSLKWAVMPKGNTTNNYSGKLPDGTFSGCTSLEEVYIGRDHTEIDTKAFYNCGKLHGVVWTSGSINSIGADALYNVPSSCTFVSVNNMESWTSANGFSYNDVTGVCSDNTYSSQKLTYYFNTDNRRLSFSGSGDMSSTPWSVYHYLIKNISFESVDNTYKISSRAFESCESLDTIIFNNTNNGTLTIEDNAFYNCTGTTFWLNIPENTVSIGANAFNNTNINYVTIPSKKIALGNDAFGQTGGARILGVSGSGVLEFVNNGRAKGYNWNYECLVHNYMVTNIPATCNEQGHNTYSCTDCDSKYDADYTAPLKHNYKYLRTDGAVMVYECALCSETEFNLDPISVYTSYVNAISHENDNPPYHQSNYSSVADIYTDGYVNAKDFIEISKAMNNIDVSNTKTVIDEAAVYQTIEGFGASACWWSQDAGGWENIDDIMELLYGKQKGIGLNIYRYNLAAGSENDGMITTMNRRGEDFLNGNSNIEDASTYDWNADMNAQKALASAQKANSNLKLTLFSNSAPVSLTKNGKAYCSNGASSNLDESSFQAFATYVVNCAEHFTDMGYNVTNVSPINEPEWDWAADNNGYAGQEGCHFTAGDARTFYNDYMIPALKNSSLNGKVDLSVWECAQLNHSNKNNYKMFLPYMFSNANSYKNSNANIREYVDSFDTHSYWASTSDRQQVANDLSNSAYSSVKKVRCTEYCQMTNDGNTGVLNLIEQAGSTNGMTIPYGIALADIIYQDLTILNAVEWDWWTACASGIYPDGLVYIDYNNHSNILTSKRLWCMGNFSKFIEEGAVRVGVSAGNMPSTVEQCAFKNPDGSIAIVYINKGTTPQYTAIDGYSSCESYVTDAYRDLELCQSNSDGSKIAIPAQSVTTVVVK